MKTLSQTCFSLPFGPAGCGRGGMVAGPERLPVAPRLRPNAGVHGRYREGGSPSVGLQLGMTGGMNCFLNPLSFRTDLLPSCAFCCCLHLSWYCEHALMHWHLMLFLDSLTWWCYKGSGKASSESASLTCFFQPDFLLILLQFKWEDYKIKNKKKKIDFLGFSFKTFLQKFSLFHQIITSIAVFGLLIVPRTTFLLDNSMQ